MTVTENLQLSDAEISQSAMVALYPPADLAAQLALDGGEPVDQLHITLQYLGKGEERPDRAQVADLIASVVADWQGGPLEGTFNGEGCFDTPDGHAHVLTLDCPAVGSLREALHAALAEQGVAGPDSHGFVPHLTLDYHDQTACPVTPQPPMADVRFDVVTLTWGGERQDFPLTEEETMAPDTLQPDTAPTFTVVGVTQDAARWLCAVPMGDGEAGYVFDTADSSLTDVSLSAELVSGDWVVPPGDIPQEVSDAISAALTAPGDMPAPAPAAPAPPTATAVGLEAALEPGQVIQFEVGPNGVMPDAPIEWEMVPVLEGVETDDSGMVRIIRPGVLEWRDPPFALTWAPTSEGHETAVRAGTVHEIRRNADGTIVMRGSIVGSADGEAFRAALARNEAGWPSVELGGVQELVSEDPLPEGADPALQLPDLRIETTAGSIVAVCVCQTQAIEGTYIRLLQPGEATAVSDVPVEPMVASAGTWAPSRDWFTAPPDEFRDEDGYCPPTVLADGRLFGHLAGWDWCHIGHPGCTNPPPSPTGYAHCPSDSHGAVVCADGTEVRVAPLVMGKGHAPLEMASHRVKAFYDGGPDATVAGWVVAGEDDYGPWVAGMVNPDLSDAEVARFKALSWSGDWRDLGVGLDLIAVGAGIHTPGFQRPRAQTLVASGERQALVIVTPPVRALVAAAIGDTSLPLADRELSWDAGSAEAAMKKLASSDGSGDPATIDWTSLARGYLWRDDSADPETFAAYRLPFCDVVNGKLEIVPRGVFACAGVMAGARGGVKGMPAGDADTIKGKINGLYRRMADEFNDPTITPPDMTAVTASSLPKVLAEMALERLDSQVGYEAPETRLARLDAEMSDLAGVERG